MKTCKKCGALFDGLRCKECRREYDRKWVAENKARKRETNKRYEERNPEKVKQSKRAYDERNREVQRIKSAIYYSQNKEKAMSATNRWRANNRDKARSYYAKWREANPDKVVIALKRWKSAHPEMNRIYCQNRKARLGESGCALSKDLAGRLIKLQKGKCACGCGRKLSDGYHLDHIMPLALGGKNEDVNIQLLSNVCNLSKHAKHPVEFMQSRGFLI